MISIIVFGMLSLLLLALSVLLLDQLGEAREKLRAAAKKLAETEERLDAVAVPGSAETWRLEAGRAQTAAALAQKLCDDKARHVATLLNGRREDEQTIRLLRTEVERLERRQMVAQVFPRLGLHVGRA